MQYFFLFRDEEAQDEHSDEGSEEDNTSSAVDPVSRETVNSGLGELSSPVEMDVEESTSKADIVASTKQSDGKAGSSQNNQTGVKRKRKQKWKGKGKQQAEPEYEQSSRGMSFKRMEAYGMHSEVKRVKKLRARDKKRT